MKPRLGGLLALALTLLAAPAAGQDGLPLEPARTLDFTVSSGTFTSLAVSPDGRTILFDMLGEIYAVPATGSRAEPVAIGLAFEVQPVFYPDGKWLAYLSARSGGAKSGVPRPAVGAPR